MFFVYSDRYVFNTVSLHLMLRATLYFTINFNQLNDFCFVLQKRFMTKQPGRPFICITNTKGVQRGFNLKWHEYKRLDSFESYQLKFRETDTDKWFIYESETLIAQPSVFIHGLKPKTSYIFKVRVANWQTSEEGPFSDESEVIKTRKSTADFLLSKSVLIQEKNPKIYMLPIKEIKAARDNIYYTRKYTLGK